MSSSLPTGFVFATCQPGSNPWLKQEVAREHAQLRLAYSATGLVTWKTPVALPATFRIHSPLARVSGFSLGSAQTPQQVTQLVESVVWERRPRLHVFGTQQDPADSALNEVLLAAEQQLRSQATELWDPTPATPGAWVVDLVLSEVNRPWFVGVHLQRADRPNLPGLCRAVPTPDAAPSRAFSKLEEMLLFAEVEPRPGAHAVELGAAPGGAAYALLQRGLHVTAIDPAAMDPALLQSKGPVGNRVQHLAVPAGEVQRAALPKHVQVWVMDMNLAPAVALRYLERLCALRPSRAELALLTLKMNDAKVQAKLPQLLERCAALGQRLGLDQLRVAQLCSHRQELGVVLRRAPLAA